MFEMSDSTRPPRWFTCTPVSFRGDDSTFFSRDSGAFCRAFQALGVESKAVMPTPAYEDDDPSLIRTEYRNLESVDWWRQFDLDGVLFYVWNLAQYRPIVEAARASGAKTVLFQDCRSEVFPWFSWKTQTAQMFRQSRLAYPESRLHSFAAWASLLVRQHLTVLRYPGRRRLFDAADLITFPFPRALENWTSVPFLMSSKAKSNVVLAAPPVSPRFTYDGTPKENLVVAVGRWDDEEPKRGTFLLGIIDAFFASGADVTEFHIFGNTPEFLVRWHESLPRESRKRVVLHGRIPNSDLVSWYRRAKAILVPSIHEGTHIASAEAVCSGCAVVASPLPTMSCCHWYASESSGTIAQKDTANSFAEALRIELEAWNAGNRNPESFSAIWRNRLHAPRTAERILRHFEAMPRTH